MDDLLELYNLMASKSSSKGYSRKLKKFNKHRTKLDPKLKQELREELEKLLILKNQLDSQLNQDWFVERIFISNQAGDTSCSA